MYSNVIRSDEYKQQLLDFIRREYGIDATGIYPAKRGYYGETWKVYTPGRSCFLKLDYSADHKRIYERSFPVVEHLCNNGIDFISRIVKTSDGKLSTRYDGAVLGLFEWIEGENRQDEHTKILEYQMLGKVYTVPAEGLVLPREDFSAKIAETFLRGWESLPPDTPVRAVLEPHRAKIAHKAERLRLFSGRCIGGLRYGADVSPCFITHGDAGGNVIVSGDKHYIVDWDNPILAPPERDAWFCLYWDWAMDAFHEALRENGINYKLRPELLAYYCYHSFFFYLGEYMQTYFDIGDSGGELSQALSDYFCGWIEEELRYADRMT